MKRADIVKNIYNSLHTLKTVNNIVGNKKANIREKVNELEREAESILMKQFDEIEVADEYVKKINENAQNAKDKIKTNGVEMAFEIASYIDEAIKYTKKIKELI